MPGDPTILGETIAAIEAGLGPALDGITIERLVVGLFFTGVKLNCGSAGACATPIKTIPEAVCCPSSAMAMPFPGKLRGRRAIEVTREAFAADGIRRAIGIATVNALADACWRRRPSPDVVLRADLDAFDAAAPQPGEQVVVVGAFGPFLRQLKRRNQPYLVLERDATTLRPDELPFFRPAEQAAAVMPQADLALITGTTLLNDSLEDLLASCRPGARVVVVGPTVSLVPDALISRGVDLLGTIRIGDPDGFLDMLAEGGSGYHLFGRSAERVVLERRAA
jgi:uncharacterized protein (DUF4213/DUF364 family)